MITQTKIRLCFPEGASFSEAPSLIIYKKMLAGIKRISCTNSKSKCSDCPSRSDCRYYWITGNNFDTVPGLYVQRQLFEPKLFHKNECCLVHLFWIGETGSFSVLTEPFIEQLNQKLNGQPFYLQSCINEAFNQQKISVRRLKILSPVVKGRQMNESDPFLHMRETFQTRYQARCEIPDSDFRWTCCLTVNTDPVRLPTKTLSCSGHVGFIEFEHETSIDTLFLEVGLGLSSCIGGGKIEADNHL